MTAGFLHDRIMSLHRRAFKCSSLDDWWILAEKLECPVECRDQFWRTAQTAKREGMTEKQAFPYVQEIENALGESIYNEEENATQDTA